MNRRIIRLCKTVAFITEFATNMLAPLLISMRAEYHIGVRQSGILLSCLFAGCLIGCICCSHLLVRFDKIRLLRTFIPLLGVSGLFVALSPAFFITAAMISLVGIFDRIVQITANALPTELSDRESASSINGVMAFNALGACCGLTFSGALVTFGFSWRAVYFLYFIAAMSAALLSARIPHQVQRQRQKPRNKELSVILRCSEFWLLFILMALYSGGESGISSWMVTYLVQEHSFTTFMSSAVSALIWIGVFVGRAACEKISRYIPAARLELFLMPMAAASIIPVPFLSGKMIWLCAFLIGLSLSGIWTLAVSLVIDNSDFDNGNVLTASFICSCAGSSASTYIIGSVAEQLSMPAAIISDGSIFLIMLALFIFWLHFHKQNNAGTEKSIPLTSGPDMR